MKKYFKYILLTFILLLGFNLDVKAANNCQYSLKIKDDAYFTINFEYTDKFTNDMKYYYCVSDSKLQKVCKDSQASIGMFQLKNEKLKDYWVMAENASTGYYDLSVGFQNGQCPELSMKYDVQTGLFGRFDGYVYFDLKGAENPSGGGNIKTISADINYSTSSSKDADKKITYNHEGTTINLITTSKGERKLEIKKDSETKICPVADQKVLCKLKDGSKYVVMPKEIDNLWNEVDFAYIIELHDNEFYITKYDTYKDVKGYYDGIDVVEKEDKYNGEIIYLADICKENTTVVTIMRVVGYALVIVKILVPLLLIAFGIISFSKVVINGDEGETKKAASGLLIKFIAAVVIFVLPTIINFIFETIDGAADGTEDYKNCRICIFDPGDCDIP